MNQPTTSTPQPEPPELATIGSGREEYDWPLFQWAKKTGNAKVLRLLFDTAGVTKATQPGICLHFLAKPSISNLLEIWGDEDIDAARLSKLATDLRAAPTF